MVPAMKTRQTRRSRILTGIPDAVDVHVGSKVRLLRNFLGITQTQLAETIDVAFQQIQKYEKGTNRISASRLWNIAEVLEVPIDFFFDGLKFNRTERIAPENDPMHRPETLDFIATFYNIGDPEIRQVFLRLLCAAGGSERR